MKLKALLLIAISLALLLSAASADVAGPRRSLAQDGCSVLDSTKPPQYMAYAYLEEVASQPKVKERQRVWLRLYNNTSCAILMDAEQAPAWVSARPVTLADGSVKNELTVIRSDAPPDGTTVELSYRIRQNARAAPMLGTFHHNVFSVRLLPGRFVKFWVPLKLFKDGSDVLMDFDYEWELRKDGGRPGGIKVFHSVYFFNEDLPEEALKQKRD